MHSTKTAWLTKSAINLPRIGSMFYSSFIELKKNDPLRMAAATAFFTTFALPPILIILIRIFGIFTDRRQYALGIFKRLETVLDASSITQIRLTLRNIRNLEHDWYVTVISFIFFLFVASTLFNVIRNTVDQIWSIRMKSKVSFLSTLVLRLKSIAIILLAGMLFLVSLFIEGLQAFLSDYLAKDVDRVLNQLIVTVITTTWFAVLFRMLTNGRPAWKMAIWGGLVTSILFNVGKYLVRLMLAYSNIGNIYGASGSIILIMLFVFYSSLIFYFGACFIKVLSKTYHCPIVPVKGASIYGIKDSEK